MFAAAVLFYVACCYCFLYEWLPGVPSTVSCIFFWYYDKILSFMLLSYHISIFFMLRFDVVYIQSAYMYIM